MLPKKAYGWMKDDVEIIVRHERMYQYAFKEKKRVILCLLIDSVGGKEKKYYGTNAQRSSLWLVSVPRGLGDGYNHRLGMNKL